MTLDKISNITVGVVLSRKKAEYKTSKSIKYEIFNLKIYEERQSGSKIEYEQFISNEDLSEYTAKKGDLLFRLAVPLKVIEVDEELEGKLISNQYVIIKVNTKKYNQHFLKWFLEGKELEHQLEKYLVGTAVRTIPVIKIREIRIPEITLNKQAELAKVVECWNKQKRSFNELVLKKEKYYNSVINKLINGGNK